MGEWETVIILLIVCVLFFGGISWVIYKALTGDTPHFNRKWER